jgi:hypothetical protein
MYDATTGRNAGANVDVITKGGTNEFHATMFEFFRNEDLNANDWFTKRGRSRVAFCGRINMVLPQAVHWSGTRFCSLVPGRAQSSINETDPSNHKLDYLPPLTNDRSPTGLGAVFGGQIGYLGAWAGVVAADGSNIAPQALALLQAKLPNGQYLVPTPTSINTAGVDPAKYGEIDSEGTAEISQPGYFNENQWMANGDYLLNPTATRSRLRYFGALSNVEWTTLYQTEGNPLYQPERFDVASVSETPTP